MTVTFMKKNIIIISITAVVVAALVGVMFFVMNLPENEESGISSDTLDILLYDKTSVKPEEITVENSGGTYTLLGFDYTKELEELSQEAVDASSTESGESSAANIRQDDVSVVQINMHYTMQGLETMELSKDATDALAYQCSYVTALQLVDKTGTRYKEFGLDKPSAKVKVIFSDGSQETLMLGNAAPNDMGIYFRRDKNPNVYLVSSENVTAFQIEKLQMLDKTITKKFNYDTDEDVEITSISISGTGYEKPLQIDKNPDISLASTYKIRSPYLAACGKDAAQSFGRTMYGIDGTEVAAAAVTDEDKKKFGLDNPFMRIQVEASDETKIGLLVSKAEKDGSCYIMADDGDLICKMTKSDVEGWYGVKVDKFITVRFVYPNIDWMDKAVITAQGQSTQYDITHNRQENDLMEEFTITTILAGTRPVEYSDFNTFINNLGGLSRTGIDIKSADGFEEVFKAELSYSGTEGEKVTDVLSLRKGSDGSYIVVLNDRVEGYTEREYAEKLIAQANNITKKGMIESLLAADEDDENAEDSQTSEPSAKTSEPSQTSGDSVKSEEPSGASNASAETAVSE